MIDLSCLECQDIKTCIDFKCTIETVVPSNFGEGTPSRSHFSLSLINFSFQANGNLWTTI